MELTRSQRKVLEQIVEELRLTIVKEEAASDPKALINEIRFFDPAQADNDKVGNAWIEFRMFPPERWQAPVEPLQHGEWEFAKGGTQDWYWQTLLIDWWHDPSKKKFLILKARQLGVTLLACAYALWLLLFRPGSFVVAYSYEEGEAKKLVQACWAMYMALPEVLRSHVKVLTPSRSEEPAEWIKLRHPDGRISGFQALPATKKHGHGTRVSFAIMDEVARMDYAREIYTAINPATTRGRAKLVMISTAAGVSNLETGVGNYFHWLYHTRKEKKLEYRFLPWNLEPTRDAAWYEAEAMKLDEVERNQQYPLTEADAFMLSGHLYFDADAMRWYRHEQMRPILTGQFALLGRRRANFVQFRDGVIEVFEKPVPERPYALCVDCATGRGTDFTSAHVIDLESGALCAELHAKMEAPRAAVQLHYLGRWFNEALICVERQGGYGDALIIALKDGNQNLPAYRRVYRHRKYVRGDRPMAEEWGFPMGIKTREQVLNQLKDWVRQRLFPWISAGDMSELGTFVYADTNPSPRAMAGCNDDRVISLALCVEMFRQFGRMPSRRTLVKKSKYRPSPARTH
jgi:hypothetical protein